MNRAAVRVGQLRPSQLLWAFGIGALIDLPRLSMVILGLDEWDSGRCVPVTEARLLDGVRGQLGPQVERLLAPPMPESGKRYDPFSRGASVGVPVAPFPGWLRCPFCSLLAPWGSGLFELETDPFRMDRNRFRHENCNKARRPIVVPARFVVACRDGHLDDFPWHWFVHRGPSSCRGRLEFFERGASLETRNLWVKCVGCGTPSRPMSDAFGEKGRDALPACRGRHPHLRHSTQSCDKELRTVLLGASNSWFPVTLSVLSIPNPGGPVQQTVEDLWYQFADAETRDQFDWLVKVLRKEGKLPDIDPDRDDELWAAIERRRDDETSDEEPDFKSPEWAVLTHPDPPREHPDFLVTPEKPPKGYEGAFRRTVLAERLREVNALIGFTRVDPPEEGTGDEKPVRAPLSRSRPTWVPATEVRGEGLFLEFDAARIREWSQREEVRARARLLFEGHRLWRAARRLTPLDEHFPGVVYAMIHTFAHALLRELALECGYSAASIRERIYATEPGAEVEMAGLLLYTAAPDSDGTLGGLVSLGEPETLGRIIRRALERAAVCSSDPLCAEHEPDADRSLHGAACHACTFVSETSCELGNRYLDRALLVPADGAAFFEPA